MNKVHPRGYLGLQDWLWWANTVIGGLLLGIVCLLLAMFVLGSRSADEPCDRLVAYCAVRVRTAQPPPSAGVTP